MKNQPTRLSKFLARKISKRKVETSGVAALTFGDLIYDMARVDQRYIDGVDFSRPSKNLSSIFKIGKQNISESPETLNILHDRNYSGYTHEFVTHQWMRNQGVEVELPEKFNQTGWDAIYNGQKWQIKFNSVENVREATLKNPDIPVATDIETANEYKEKFPEDAALVLGTTPRSLTENLVSEGKEASMEVIKDEELFETGVPEFLSIASIASVIRNVSYVADDKTDVVTGAQNVAIDTVGRGAGMWAGAKVGGLVLGPLGAVVGGIGGMFLSKDIIDNFKMRTFCEAENKQLKSALNRYLAASKKMLENNQRTFEKKMAKLKSTLGSAVYRKKILKENKMTKELYDYLVSRMKEEFKERDYVLKRLTWREHATDPKKFKDFEPEIKKYVEETEEYNSQVGNLDEFLRKETGHLMKAIEKYIKAAQKRGV